MVRSPFLFACLLRLSFGLAAADPQVTVAAGTIHGTTCDNDARVVFRGIPFAKPPVGSLRFMAPQPFDGEYTGGYLNATQFAPACFQMPGEMAWPYPTESEDCLYLDVYVPTRNATGLPVKVWAHGGGNIDGTTSFGLYDLCGMEPDSVAVAINYRLGPFGFLGLDAAGIEGNMGIKDYITALEWVQQNIEAFGGDKSKVVLFGQSSGADDTFLVSTLPQATSLMSAAICESGGGEDLPPYSNVQAVGQAYARALNCTISDLSCLQSIDASTLVDVYGGLPVLSQGVGTFQDPSLSSWEISMPNSTSISSAFVDGKFITQQPLAAGPHVPIVMGSTAEDGSLFSIPPLYLSGYAISEDNYTTFLSQFGSLADRIEAQYPLSSFNASGSTAAAVTTAITTILTHSDFTCAVHRGLLSALRAGMPAYAYTFNHTPACPWLLDNGTPFPASAEAGFFGAMHTSELPLVLGNLANQPFTNGTCNGTAAEYALAPALQSMWTAMGVDGSPDIPSFSWPQFNTCSSSGLYVTNAPAATVQQLDFTMCAFWDSVWVEMGSVDLSSVSSCAGNASSSSGAGSHATNVSATPSQTPSSAGSLARGERGLSWSSGVGLAAVALYVL